MIDRSEAVNLAQTGTERNFGRAVEAKTQGEERMSKVGKVKKPPSEGG